jgi:S1-C subfamily serine protease
VTRWFVLLDPLSFNRERKEVSVTATIEGSPARKAGFMKDDIVVNIGGIEASDLATAVNAVRQAKPGSKLVFHIRRGKEERNVTVTAALLPFTVVADLE